MNLKLPDVSVAFGFDFLVSNHVKTAWLTKVNLGENLFNAFDARFNINVSCIDDDTSFVVKICFILQKVGTIKGFRLRLEFRLPKSCREFFAPGIFYRDNRYTSAAPSFFISERWVFREDRLAMRAVGALDSSKFGIIVMRLDEPLFEPPLVAHRNTCGNFVLSSLDFDSGSLGFDRRKPCIEAFLPIWEGDFRYYEKLKFTPPLGWMFPPLVNKKIEVSYLIQFCEGDVYRLLEKMVELAWKYQKRSSTREPDLSKAEKALIESLKTRYFESRKIKGLYSWVETFSNKPALGVCEPGFTGMVFLSCAKMLEYSKQSGDLQTYYIAKEVLDAWSKKAISKNGFIPDFWLHWIGIKNLRLKLDVSATFEPPFIFAKHFSIRRASEAAWGLIEAAKIEGSSLWFEKALAICDMLKSIQRSDGSFPRQVFASGKERDAGIGATPSALFVLVKAYELQNDRYKDSVRRASEFVADKMVGSFEFYGSTLDSNCEDKEAMLITFLALWNVAKLFKSRELEELAHKAAVAALSWFFLWEPQLPRSSLLSQAGLKISGLGAVSSENNHVDVYLFSFPSNLTELAVNTGNENLLNIAKLSLHRALEYIPTYELSLLKLGEEEVKFQAGVVPELIYHTDWSYYHLPIAVKFRHLAQGYVNPRSSAWCSASLLDAISSWRKGGVSHGI